MCRRDDKVLVHNLKTLVHLFLAERPKYRDWIFFVVERIVTSHYTSSSTVWKINMCSRQTACSRAWGSEVSFCSQLFLCNPKYLLLPNQMNQTHPVNCWSHFCNRFFSFKGAQSSNFATLTHICSRDNARCHKNGTRGSFWARTDIKIKKLQKSK